MNEFLFSQAKVWGIVGLVELTTQLSQYDIIMSIFVQFCGGIASLAIAYSHIKRGNKK